MKRILLLTSLYPSGDVKILNNTSVCHYFACEWAKMGYEVRVILNYNIYPLVFYPFLRLFRKQMANIFGVSIQDVYINKPFRYEQDGITVDRLPIFKAKPGGGFSEKVISKQFAKIISILEKDGYKPDLVLGHFIHPNLELVVKLIEYYSVPGTIALHGAEKVYSDKDASLFDKVNYVGFRSFPTKWNFEKLYGHKPFFMCPSGVPEHYIKSPRLFTKQVSKFVYIGTFMRRKYPSSLVPAIANVYGDEDYSITYIGDGEDKKQIINKAKDYKCIDKTIFTGRIPRDDIFQYLDKSDVFIMISKIETFGLVYLEAMSRGCIVVASKNEGMDGIIENGVNGFLCEAGNEKELERIVLKIKGLTMDQLCRMSEASVKTAQKYTDYKVAKEYIEAVNQ